MLLDAVPVAYASAFSRSQSMYHVNIRRVLVLLCERRRGEIDKLQTQRPSKQLRNGNTYSSAGDATCQINNFVRHTTLSTSSEMLKLKILQRIK